MCVTVEEYCRSHGFNDSDINSDDNGNCVSDSGPPMPVQMVVNEYSISPAEDYFNGFVLGVNKESYLSKGYSIFLISIEYRGYVVLLYLADTVDIYLPTA